MRVRFSPSAPMTYGNFGESFKWHRCRICAALRVPVIGVHFYQRENTMKTALLAALLICGTASADELVVNYGDSETLYEGTLRSFDTDGMAGFARFEIGGGTSVSQWAGEVPMLTGLWHVSLSEATGKRHVAAEGLGNCYGTIGYMADHGARIVLTCSSWDLE